MSEFEYDSDYSLDNVSFEQSSGEEDDESINLSDEESELTDKNSVGATGDIQDPSVANAYSLKHIDFKSVQPSELLHYISKEVEKLSSVLNIDTDDCYILLHYFNWNGERLMEQFMDNREETKSKAGILALEKSEDVPAGLLEDQTISCSICCDEDKTVSFAPLCGHRYCIDCYIYYVKEKVFAGASLIKCPEHSCPLNLGLQRDIKVLSDYMVANSITADVKEIEDAKKAAEELTKKAELEAWSDDEEDFQSDNEGDLQYFMSQTLSRKESVQDKTLYERYEQGSIKAYVECHSNYKWCPSPDCKGLALLQNISKNYLRELSLEHKNDLIPIVSCPFGHSFCFICNYENHVPVPCWITKLWIQKCKDDSETANWINANTKSCPKCESSIEKNGGCNHMTCKKCKYEFCWICMGVWSKHGTAYYNCSMYGNSETQVIRAKQDSSRSSLKRYLHFYNHFTAQEQSMKGDNLFCADIENKLMRIQENLKHEVSWIELQFYKESVDILLRCRRTLKWSYALIYYLKDSNFTSILTDNQLHLSNNVEKLSKLFEIFQPKQILSKKREFHSVSGYLVKREKLFIGCAVEGIIKGELQFRVDDLGSFVD